MSIEKSILYDNPSAPLVRFSSIDCFDDDDEYMTNDDNTISTESTLENSYQAFSLENLVQSFDQTINECSFNKQISLSNNTSQIKSNTWSDLIENLRTSLRQDLKLPQLIIDNRKVNDIPTIDDCNDEQEEEFNRKSSLSSFSFEPFLTAEQVLSEIDFMLEDMTPDSGYGDHLLGIEDQSIESLNLIIKELNESIQNLSTILVDELAKRDEFEDEKEMKNTFIELLFRIQNKRRSFIRHSNKSDMYLTTVIPFDRKHLSNQHLRQLNEILQAIYEENIHLPELLTNYILKFLCC